LNILWYSIDKIKIWQQKTLIGSIAQELFDCQKKTTRELALESIGIFLGTDYDSHSAPRNAIVHFGIKRIDDYG